MVFPFGVGVGDFVKVVEFAWKIFERCRVAPEEFKDVTRDVRAMHIVLKAIKDYWEENPSTLALSTKQREDLQYLSQGCHEPLCELESVLDRYRSLGSSLKRKIDRIRWAMKNLGPIRSKLHTRTVQLSVFNTTITYAAHAKESAAHAKVLRGLSTLYLEYQEGKRVAPAFTHASATEIEGEDKDTWKAITADLSKAGANPTAISASHDLIKFWISQVVLALDKTNNIVELSKDDDQEDFDDDEEDSGDDQEEFDDDQEEPEEEDKLQDLPYPWEKRLDPSGRTFYVDHSTKSTTWIHPRLSRKYLGSLPSGWEMRITNSAKVYFVNHNNETTTWEDPRWK